MKGDRERRTRKLPLVSIGLPTFNRAHRLRRAIESVLAQDYPHFELIISDNASADDTMAICSELREKDPRVRYIRQRRNQGLYRNFQEVFRQSRGEYFMWLSDDDWIDSSYVGHCVSALLDDADLSVVCGTEHYDLASGATFRAPAIDLLDDRGWRRLLRYFGHVWTNGTFHGVMPRDGLANAPLRDAFGADWLLTAAMAYQGKVRTLPATTIHRSFGGASGVQSTSDRRWVKALREGVSYGRTAIGLQSIAVRAFQEITWRGPAYCTLCRPGRVALGFGSALVLATVNLNTIVKGAAAFLWREVRGDRNAPLPTRYAR